ncbi:MAG: porin [Pseudomonadota bacterium]
MNYRTGIYFCAAMMGTVPAFAQQSQGSVTLYGLIDQGLERASGTSGPEYRVASGTAASRWGVRGNEDLGGGWNAVFTLESGIAVDTGASGQGGRLFGRQAFVGLKGDFGTVTVGRQLTMRFFGMMDADLFGAGAHGTGVLDSGIPNARADNSISYMGKWGGFSGGLNYSFGRDASPAAATTSAAATNCPGETSSAKQCREWSLMVKYDAGSWGVVGAYERQHGGTPALAATATFAAVPATFGGLTSPDKKDARLTVNAYMKIDKNQIGVGVLRRNNEGSATPKSGLYWLAAQVPVPSTALVIDGMVSHIKFDNSSNKAAMLNLRASYWLSRRTNLYVSTAYIRNGGNLALAASSNIPVPRAGGSQSSVIMGIKHTF